MHFLMRRQQTFILTIQINPTLFSKNMNYIFNFPAQQISFKLQAGNVTKPKLYLQTKRVEKQSINTTSNSIVKEQSRRVHLKEGTSRGAKRSDTYVSALPLFSFHSGHCRQITSPSFAAAAVGIMQKHYPDFSPSLLLPFPPTLLSVSFFTQPIASCALSCAKFSRSIREYNFVCRSVVYYRFN